MYRSEVNHSVFFCHHEKGKCIYLVVYIDDFIITGNDDKALCSSSKAYLVTFNQRFQKIEIFFGN